MERLLKIIKNIFNRLDSRLLGHGERVAYIVYTILNEENKYSTDQIKDAVVLALLHDIGALRTDEIDNLITFDSVNTQPHCIYGYLFLKYFSPLNEKSEVILYHHTPEYELDKHLTGFMKDICGLIHLADRIDIWHINPKINTEVFKNANNLFNNKYYQLFCKMNQEKSIIETLVSKEYFDTLHEIDLLFNFSEVKKYLEMIVYAIDFRSYQTVTHSLLVALIAINLGKLLNLPKQKLKELYYSSLLHDVGKVTTPIAILEKAGKLTDEEMAIMQKHVVASKEIIAESVSDSILYPAIRHHERLDGSGYPDKIDENDLTTEDNIIIIADIVGALVMKRSYKEPFTKGKTLSILSDLVDNNKVDKHIFQILVENYDNIISDAQKRITSQERKFVNIKKEYEEMLTQ